MPAPRPSRDNPAVPVPKKGGLLRKILLSIAAAAVFTAVALWCVHPLLPRWDTAYAGGGELEGWLWRYWWMKSLIVDAWHATTARYAFYVATVSGSYPETGNVFDLQAFSMPLEALFGGPQYYNDKVVLILVLDGLAGYWLGRLLLDDWASSVLCGFCFAFGAYVLLEIDTGRLRQTCVFPLALYAFTLMKMTPRDAPLRYAVYGGLAWGLCSTFFLFYGMSAAFMTLLWLIWLGCPPPSASSDAEARREAMTARILYVVVMLGLLCGVAHCMVNAVPQKTVLILVAVLVCALVGWITSRDGGLRLGQLTIVGLLAVASSMPYATRYIELSVKHQPLPEVNWSVDFPPLEKLVGDPNNVHSDDDGMKSALMNSMQRFRGDSVSWDFLFNEDYRRAVPLVLTVVAAAGLLVFPRRPWLFVMVMLLGYVLSLGPYLKGGNTEEYLYGPQGIKLPQAYFFTYVPFFSRLFSPIRMEGLFLLGFGVIVGWSTAMLFHRLRLWPVLRVVVVGTLIVLALRQMERAGTIPLSMTPVQVPDVYSFIASSKADGVVEVPLREGDYVNYYQIFHGKRVLDGWGTGSVPERFPDTRTRWLAEAPMQVNMDNSFLQWLRAANDGENSAVKNFKPEDLTKIASLGYTWALLHERGCYIVKGPDGHSQYQYMRKLLDGMFGKPVRTSTERVRERWAEDLQPDADGLYAYEIVLYDLSSLAKSAAGANNDGKADGASDDSARVRGPAVERGAAPRGP